MVNKYRWQFLGFFAYLCLRLYLWTHKLRFVNPEVYSRLRQESPTGKVILVFWHHNLMSTILASSRMKLTVLVGPGADGEVTSMVFRLLGHRCVRGGSKSGGAKALRTMASELNRENGHDPMIAPDGGGGPSYQPKKGAVILSARSGTPILPFIAEPDRFWETNRTWDRSRIPRFFSTVSVRFGEAISVEATDRLSEVQLTRYLHQIKSQLDYLNSLEVSS